MSEFNTTPLDDATLASVVEYVWVSVLGGPPEVMGHGPVGDEVDLLDAGVSITGVWSGACVFSCSEELGRRIAALMFGSEPEEVSADDLRDALGEMANVLGGQIKALVPEGSDISLPAVAIGPGASISFRAAKSLAEIHGRFCGEPFRFVVSRLDESALPSRRRGDQGSVVS